MDSLKLETILTPGGTRYRLAPRDETLSFDKGFFLAVKAIQILRQKTAGVTVVGIAGPSGAGKTSLAKKIVTVIPKSALIAMDNYLDSSRKIIDENYDDYRLIDFALLVKNIKDLQAGKPTETPLYDFRKSGRYAYRLVHPPESKVVIIEGTYALHDELRPLFDLSISVSGGVHFDLVKRIMRDIQRTGQEPQEALQQITETVFPMYKAFIEPDLRYAELKIVNNFNPFSGLLNPIYTLKSAKEIDPAAVLAVMDKDDPHEPTVSKYYDIFLHPPDVKPLKCKDWIRIRNNGGVYSIMFSEEIKEDNFIISPRVDFVVNVKILGGLMGLGYQVGAIIHRQSTEWRGKKIIISFDKIEELGRTFLQIKGFDRQAVQDAGEKLGLPESYIPRSYIELYQEKFGALKSNL